MSEWQPIETAPKDNVRVLVRRVGPRVGNWHNTQPIIVAHSRDGKSWWSEPGMYQCYPTHWMPLPDPPSEAGGRPPEASQP